MIPQLMLLPKREWDILCSAVCRVLAVEIIGDELAAQEYAQIMSRALKRKINYSHVPRETYASMGFPGARELADMFEFLRVYTPSRRTHIALCRQLFADMQRFETWLENNVQKFNSLSEA